MSDTVEVTLAPAPQLEVTINTVLLVEVPIQAPIEIEISEIGSQGPPGATGPVGPQGPGGEVVFQTSAPADTTKLWADTDEYPGQGQYILNPISMSIVPSYYQAGFNSGNAVVPSHWRIHPIILPPQGCTVDNAVIYYSAVGADSTYRVRLVIYHGDADNLPGALAYDSGNFFPTGVNYFQFPISPPITVPPGKILWTGGVATLGSGTGFTTTTVNSADMILPSNSYASTGNPTCCVLSLYTAGSNTPPPNPWPTADKRTTSGGGIRVGLRVSAVTPP